MSDDIMWWGYLHSNGEIQVKQWFGDHKDYTDDCIGNPFVKIVVRPFSSPDRDTAYQYIKTKING